MSDDQQRGKATPAGRAVERLSACAAVERRAGLIPREVAFHYDLNESKPGRDRAAGRFPIRAGI